MLQAVVSVTQTLALFLLSQRWACAQAWYGGNGMAGGFAFYVWNIIEVVTSHYLTPLMLSHPCWLAAAWLSSASPGKQHFLSIIASHLPHQWAQPSLARRWESCLLSLLLLGVKLDKSLVGEERETPVFPLTMKGGIFYGLYFSHLYMNQFCSWGKIIV